MNTLERFSLQGKTAVITGAGRFLGRYHCKALAEAGAAVVATEKAACEGVAHEVSQGVLAYAADVIDPVSLRRLLDAVVERTGHIDVLVNNAAVGGA